MLDVKQHLSKAKLRLLEFVRMNETLGSNEIEEKQEKKEDRAQATGVKEMTHCSLYTVSKGFDLVVTTRNISV